MSRDIRSYFMQKKPAAKPAKPSIVLDEDDDVIPESPDVQIKAKKKESRKKRCISDSDEEIFESKKKKTVTEPSKSSKNKSIEKPKLQEVKPVDLFGSGPIKRTEPLVKKVKKNTETGIHSDEEFEKSLLEVDAEELATKICDNVESSSNNENECTTKTNNSSIEKSVKIPHEEQKNEEKVKHEDSHLDTKDTSKEKSPHIQNGDSLGQELIPNTEKDHKSKDNKHSHSDSKKERREHDSKKSKESKHSHSKSKKEKEIKKEHTTPKKDEKVEESKSIPKKEKKDNGDCSSKEKKRDFSEFAESDASFVEDHEDKHKNKKKKMDKSLNESALTDEERHERKMHSAALYQKYLNRSGPKHLGAKEIPEGAPNCLANCAFLLTGVLDSFERDEVADAIARFGGTVKSGISKKVTHVLAGDDAGPAKMAKAQELGIKIIGEDEFLQMIIDLSKKPSSNKLDVKRDKSPGRKHLKKEEKTPKKDHKERKDKSQNRKEKDKSPRNKEKKSDTTSETKISIKSEDSSKDSQHKSKSPQKSDSGKTVEIKSITKLDKESKSISSFNEEPCVRVPSEVPSSIAANSILWVEKYKPRNLKQIIGQHGDASNVKKLMNWLTKWYVNRKAKLIKPSPWAKNDDGGYYKAALLSGPPGVGKTTTVALVCKELGFDTVELNASDTRNKSLIREQIGELLTTTSLSAYAKGDKGKQAVTKKHVLVMDEVDGMAGNEDRGGLQELISLIKSTSVPIICMCNDRNSPKMRSLVNYCYDLRFNRPRVEQIKSAMMSICCKEGIKIPGDALTQLIIAANQDVRQTLNLLSMWAVDPALDNDKLKKDAQSGKKDIKLGPWEAVRKVFSAEEHKTMSLSDKSDLFFYDYSLAPLFVQENYLHVQPHCPKGEVLERFAQAAESISLGDIVDAKIRGNQAWGLLPIQAMYASVIPGTALSGHVSGQINFPAWLGNNSRANKMHRLAQQIHMHTRLSTTASKSSIYFDYAPHLRDAIISPLLKDKSDGIDKSLEVLEAYHLLREDLDSLVELSEWPGQRNPLTLVDPKVKAAMTRAYNKRALALPYAPAAVRRARGGGAPEGEGGYGDDAGEGEDDEEPDSDPEHDALIKKKKKVKEEKASSSKEKPGTSKAETSKEKPAKVKTTKKKK